MTMPKYDLEDKVAIVTKMRYSHICIECGIISAIRITKAGTTYDIKTDEDEYHNIPETIVFPINDVTKKVNKLILAYYESRPIDITKPCKNNY